MVYLSDYTSFSSVKWVLIALFWPNCKKEFLYSSTWSYRSILIFLPIRFFIRFFHLTNNFRASTLCLIGLYSTTPKVIIYNWDKLPMASSDAFLVGLQTSTWIQSRTCKWWVSVLNFTFFLSRTQLARDFKLHLPMLDLTSSQLVSAHCACRLSKNH